MPHAKFEREFRPSKKFNIEFFIKLYSSLSADKNVNTA